MRKCLQYFFLFIGVTCFSGYAEAAPQCLVGDDVWDTQVLVDIPVDNVTPVVTSKDVGQFIPTDVNSKTTTTTMLSKMADKSFAYLMNNSALKESGLIQKANSLQEKMKADVVIPASSNEGVSHRFTMKYELFQALAKFEYVGWTKASLNYDAKSASTNVHLEERVLDNKNLYLEQKVSSAESMSTVGISWKW